MKGRAIKAICFFYKKKYYSEKSNKVQKILSSRSVSLQLKLNCRRGYYLYLHKLISRIRAKKLHMAIVRWFYFKNTFKLMFSIQFGPNSFTILLNRLIEQVNLKCSLRKCWIKLKLPYSFRNNLYKTSFMRLFKRKAFQMCL